MTAQIFPSLLGLSGYEVWDSLQSLRLALYVPEDFDEEIFVPNAFLDYIFDKGRSGDSYCDETRINGILADKCINVIKNQLQFGIYSLGLPFLPDEEVANLDDQGKDHDPNAITYTCCHWSEHLQEGRRQEGFNCQEVNDYLSKQLGLCPRIEN